MSSLITPSEFELEHIELTTHSGTVMDLRVVVNEINIYEDMFADSLAASLLIVDGMNIIANGPLFGGEKVNIKYRTPGMSKWIDVEFYVARITDRITNQNRTQSYWLHLVSLEKYMDPNISVSQSFSGVYSDMVMSVLQNMGTAKTVVTDPSNDLATVVIPSWSPLKTIKWMAARAHDSSGSPMVVFETVDGFYMRSMASMFKSNVKRTYLFEPKGQEAPIHKQFVNIERYQIKETNNKQNLNKRGVFEQVIDQFDVLQKKATQIYHNYTKEFESITSLEPHKVFDDLAGKRSKKMFAFTREDKSHTTIYQRNVVMGLLGDNVINIEIPGDSELRVGDIVEFDIPSQEQHDGDIKITKYMSGKFLVTSIKHTISNKSKYMLSVELRKDSYSTETPQGGSTCQSKVNTSRTQSTTTVPIESDEVKLI